MTRTRHSLPLAAACLLFCFSTSIADFASGDKAYNSGDYATALATWEPLAESGDAASQFGLGLLYANGFGVSMDDDQALKWYGLAATQGHGNAQCNLAVMHANGWGVPQSDAEALKWYSLAADNGNTAAQIGLANMHLSGLGTEQSNFEAYKWFSVAAELGSDQAGFDRDSAAEKLTTEEKSAADSLVAAWLESHQAVVQSGQ